MDTLGPQAEKPDQAFDAVAREIARIKQQMPNTYKAIQAKAAEPGGAQAYAWVRRALKGEPNCFFAVEGAQVAGVPFAVPGMMQDVLALMAQFGVPFGVIWPLGPTGGRA